MAIDPRPEHPYPQTARVSHAPWCTSAFKQGGRCEAGERPILQSTAVATTRSNMMTTGTARNEAKLGVLQVNLLWTLFRPLPVLLTFLALLLTFSAVWAAQSPLAAQGHEAPLISLEQALILLESPDTIFVDVRSVASYRESGVRIPGSQWRHPLKPEQWLADYPRDKTLILYCV